MTELLTSLSVEGFRAISGLKVSSFGRVNLITGRNNSGKSSLLEAIRILVTGGSLKTIYEILNYREEFHGGDPDRTYGYSDFAPFCSLFTGFPDISASEKGLSISAVGSIPASLASISVNIKWFTSTTDPDRSSVRYEPVTADLFGDVEGFPALEMNIAGRRRVVPLDRLSRRSIVARQDIDVIPVACVYLDPFSSRSTSQLGALWDAIALTDSEKEVVKAIRVISEDIEAVSMIGSDDRSTRARTVIAKSRRFPSPVPLRTFGDGVNRLFGIILSLCNARNGVLLVDEIENGLHFSVQADIWRTIFRLSRDLNVQVFATSHSWDCVRSFQEAAAESPADGVLVRVTKRDDVVSATMFTEKELAIATRDQIEVR